MLPRRAGPGRIPDSSVLMTPLEWGFAILGGVLVVGFVLYILLALLAAAIFKSIF